MYDDRKGAAVRFPPPLIYLISILAAYGAHRFRPIGLGGSAELRIIGIVLAVVGLGSIVGISLSFRRARTSIEPWRPTTTIISSGLYAYTRNPIYVLLCLMQIGTGLFLNSLWVLCSFVLSLVGVYYIAIRKEEIYLEKKFGDEYLRYKSKVRRWL